MFLHPSRLRLAQAKQCGGGVTDGRHELCPQVLENVAQERRRHVDAQGSFVFLAVFDHLRIVQVWWVGGGIQTGNPHLQEPGA